jgi:4,5-dihydroxyphthalate decarboxylase
MVLRLSFACWDYDRMKAIEDGRVQAEGIDLTFLNYRVEETCVTLSFPFWRKPN